MRSPIFNKLGNALAVFGILCLILSGAGQARPASAPVTGEMPGDLAIALQTICSGSGLRHAGGEGPSSPHEPGSIACSLCCLQGPSPLAFVPASFVALPSFTALAFLLPAVRQTDSFLVTRPPSRAPPRTHIL
ncbi:MAG: hypothetical protein COA65_05685 [Rhodospirillaceae bacterium]|nr:MAG: hypothetical protein COA65_05685 [Rhodospirillaceae bacterium]